MKYVLMFVLLFSVSGCKDEWKIAVAKNISVASAPVIAMTWNCANQEEIRISANATLLKLKILKPDTSQDKGIGNALCTELLSATLPMLIKKDGEAHTLPEKWECTGTNAEQPFRLVSKTVCSVLPI